MVRVLVILALVALPWPGFAFPQPGPLAPVALCSGPADGLGGALTACRESAIQPAAAPLMYATTIDMLLVVATLAGMALVVSSLTDNRKVLDTTYLLFSLTSLVLIPGAIARDWIYLLTLP